MPQKFICVAGNIGSGKSTVSALLANHLGWVHFAEKASENPFLEGFYRDPKTYAFRSQRFFLLSRILHHEQITSQTQACVQDGSVYQDAEIYAKLQRDLGHMTSGQYAKYRQLYDVTVKDLQEPNLMLYLRTSIEALRNRIRNRGRPYEVSLVDAKNPYLLRLQEAHERWIEQYDISPKLIVNSDKLNVSGDPVHVKKFLLAVEGSLKSQTKLVNYYEPD